MRSSACLTLPSLLVLSAFLTGCSLTANAPPSPQSGSQLSGMVHGGQQPVTGAHVYLFAAGTTGYGSAATSLLSSGTAGTDALGSYVTTDSNGFWAITGDYTCTAGSQVFLLATQGNPGLSGNATNANLALMAALSQCPSSGSLVSADPSVVINEVTTAASAYALSGFMTDLIHVGSPNTALAKQGIANAFANVNNLVNVATGSALSATPNGNGTVPQPELNTIANTLAACVDSAGGVSGDGSACGTLFANALNGSTAPTDTVTAAVNIAHNPAANVSALYMLGTASAPFAPTLTATPNDLTLSLTFTDSSLNAPAAIAIDGTGDAWIANSGANTVTQLSPLGVASSFSAGGIADPVGIAVDSSGNIWTANTGTVSEISSSGSAVGTSPYTGTVSSGGQFQPRGIAIDGSGDAWVANFGAGEYGGLYEFNSSGNQISPANGYNTDPGNIDTAAAIDPSGNGWAMDIYVGSLDEYNSSGTRQSPTSGWDPGINSPEGIAIDHSGNVWVANRGSNVTEVTIISNAATTHSYTGGGVHYSQAIAIDGLGNVWIPNTSFSSTPGVLSEFSNAGTALSPSTGFVSASTINPTGVAVDGSGDVWTCNNYTNFNNNTSTYTITEFIGAAAPVVTPLATGVKNGTLATRP